MARKICVKLILELRKSGLSVNQIASSRHISKHSVSDVFRIAKEKDIRFKDIQFLDEYGGLRAPYSSMALMLIR